MAKTFHANAVAMNTATTGTGTITVTTVLDVAHITAAQAGVVDGQLYSYKITDGSDVEFGTTIAGGSATTFTRVLKWSKIGGAYSTVNKINLSGNAVFRIIEAAEDIDGKAELGNPNTFTDTQTITPPSGTLNRGLTINQSGPTSGSSVGPWSGNLINATFGATVTGSSDPFFDNGAWQTWVAAHRVNFTVGGANLGGEPVGAGFYQVIANTNSVAASDGDFIGLAGEAWANATITNGAFHGLVGAAIIGASANIRTMNGLFAEADILTGGVAVARRGINIVSQGNTTATGASDTAINVAASNSPASFKNLIILDTAGGTIQPIQSTGDILKSDGAFTVANVFNLPNATVTGKIANFAKYKVDGPTGQLVAGGGTADVNTGAMVNAAVPSGGAAALISQVNGAGGFNGFHANNSTIVSSLFAVVPEPSSTGTILGVTNANYAEVVSAGSSSNGMLLGTLTASPLIFGTGNAERMRLTSGGFLNIGPAVAPDALLTVNANTGAAPTPVAGTVLHLIGADNAQNRIVQEAYSGVVVWNGWRIEGTQASKTAVPVANLMTMAGGGWNGSALVGGGQISFFSRETYSGSANGTSCGVYTTPLTTTTITESARFQPSGGVSIGATAIATDPGAGNLSVSNAVQVGSFTVAGLPSGVTGKTVFCSNCRMFNGAGVQEGAGAGTGGLVTYNGTAWKIAGTNVTAVA